MERHRNTDFDSDVELEALKDTVWRLTTRVYLLEDFIAERFGEVIGASGFTKATSESEVLPSIPNTSSSKITRDKTSDISISSHSTRRGRKRRNQGHHVVSSEVEGPTLVNIQKIMRTETDTLIDPLSIRDPLLNLEENENDLLRIEKSEVFIHDSDLSDVDDNYFNDETESDKDTNEAIEKQKDPDFNVILRKTRSPAKDSGGTEVAGQNQTVANNRPISIKYDPEYYIDTKKLKWSNYYNYIGHTGNLNMLWQCNQCPSKISVSTTSKSNAKRHYYMAHKIDIRSIKQINKEEKLTTNS